jgi:hypothetical protein
LAVQAPKRICASGSRNGLTACTAAAAIAVAEICDVDASIRDRVHSQDVGGRASRIGEAKCDDYRVSGDGMVRLEWYGHSLSKFEAVAALMM